MDEHEPTRGERREERRVAARRRPLDNRRSVFLIQRLSAEPQRRKAQHRRKRGAK